MSILERWFKLKQNGTTVGTEVVAGFTTFMVMAYIIFVNPAILSFASFTELQGQGPPFAATLAATCLVAGLMTLAMGIVTNYPFAVAAGMGLNSIVALQLIANLKLSWPAAMGVVFLEGLVITALVVTGFRQAVMEAIPMALKQAIGVGIGLFILFIGLFTAGLVKQGPSGVPVTLGDFTNIPALVAIIGLFVTLWLMARRVRGGLLLGIVITTVVAILFNAAADWKAWALPGVAVVPSQIFGLPDFSTVGQGVNLEAFVKLGIVTALLTIFSLMLTDFFDTMGTVIAVGGEAGFLDQHGRLPRLNRVLLVDSLGAVIGGAASASTATTYIESAAGVAAGGRTGLTSVVTGLCFLVALFFAPIAAIVPPQATAPALIIVGYLMCTLVREIPFADLEEGLPALMTMAAIPFTYSITDGIGAGFVTHTFLKIVRGRAFDVHWMMYLVSGAFALYFALPWLTGAVAP